MTEFDAFKAIDYPDMLEIGKYSFVVKSKNKIAVN